jgi:hypothetical protein
LAQGRLAMIQYLCYPKSSIVPDAHRPSSPFVRLVLYRYGHEGFVAACLVQKAMFRSR